MPTLNIKNIISEIFSKKLTSVKYDIRSDKLTAPIRLAVVADLHSVFYGEEQAELIEAIDAHNVDAVLLPGDIADDKTPLAGAEALFKGLAGKYPCYYVSGNNEYKSGRIDEIKSMIRAYGAAVLEGTSSEIELSGRKIAVFGVDDPMVFGVENIGGKAPKGWIDQFESCKAKNKLLKEKFCDRESYSILVSHRPELFKYYRNSGFDLVVAGHAHGGQVRIPGLINGLLAPGQGLFPKYAGGAYELGETVMVVSRGLCVNRLPRIFNPPELAIVEVRPGYLRNRSD